MNSMDQLRFYTLSDLFEKASVQNLPERGFPEPVFVLSTKRFDEAAELLQLFHLSLLPVNIPTMHSLPLPPGYKIPTGGRLMVEFSLDDPDPHHVIDSLVVPDHLHDHLAKANRESRKITIVLQEKKRNFFSKARTEVVSVIYEPYLLDWEGVVGLVTYIRNSWRNVSKDRLSSLLDALQIRLEEYGQATNVYTEMGFLHRLDENWEESVRCYTQEIKFGLTAEGQPGIGSMRAFSNLGVVYKKLQEFQKARDCFAIALSLNPNYFESLVSLAGIIEDPQIAFSCVSRAYRVRRNDPLFPTLFANMASAFSRSPDQIADMVKEASTKMDLSQPLVGLNSDSPVSLLKGLGL